MTHISLVNNYAEVAYKQKTGIFNHHFQNQIPRIDKGSEYCITGTRIDRRIINSNFRPKLDQKKHGRQFLQEIWSAFYFGHANTIWARGHVKHAAHD